MIKYIAKFQNNRYEQQYKFSGAEKADLHMLQMSFNQYNNFITLEEKNKSVYIWINLDEEEYDTWEYIPKGTLTKNNFDEIIKTWNENVKNLKKYLVFTQNNDDTFLLEAKDELSEEDLKQLEFDKESQERWSKH